MAAWIRPSTACILMFATVSAADWATWLGPNRDGKSLETGLLKSWPEGGPKVVWKAGGLGEGYSSMAVVGNRIYTQGQEGDAQFVIALDSSNGKQVWKTPFGRAFKSGQGSGPRGMPQVEGDRLYALGSDGSLACLDTVTGKKIWALSYVEKFGSTNPTWAFSESPLIDGDRLVINPGGKGAGMVALNKKTGSVIWQSQDDLANYSSVLPFTVGDVRIYTVLTASGAVAVNAKDGSLLWRYEKAGNGPRINVATPVYSDGHVFYSSGYGNGGGLMKLAADNGKVTATEVYFTRDMQNQYTTSIKVGDYLYGFSGNQPSFFVAMDFKTGKASWRERGAQKGNCIFADGLLYCQGEAGKVALIEPTPSAYKEISSFDMGRKNEPMVWVPNGNMWAYPAIANGRLYIRDQETLSVFDISGKSHMNK